MEGCNSFEVRLLLYGVWDTDIYIYLVRKYLQVSGDYKAKELSKLPGAEDLAFLIQNTSSSSH